MVTIQEVDNIDGRFIPNFSVESNYEFCAEGTTLAFQAGWCLLRLLRRKGKSSEHGPRRHGHLGLGTRSHVLTKNRGDGIRTLGEKIGEVLVVTHPQQDGPCWG